jgi:hypothetical protein
VEPGKSDRELLEAYLVHKGIEEKKREKILQAASELAEEIR